MDNDAAVERPEGLVAGPVGPRSFEDFYRGEYPVTLAVVLALRGPRVGAEEVVQEAFLRAHTRWDEVRGLAEPAHWVRRVALNLATSRWRRLGSEARALARLPVHRSASEDRGYQFVEDADRFWRAVRRLPPQQANIVALRYAANLTVDEIAAVLGKAPGTVRSSLHAARHRLASLLNLGEEMVDDPAR